MADYFFLFSYLASYFNQVNIVLLLLLLLWVFLYIHIYIFLYKLSFLRKGRGRNSIFSLVVIANGNLFRDRKENSHRKNYPTISVSWSCMIDFQLISCFVFFILCVSICILYIFIGKVNLDTHYTVNRLRKFRLDCFDFSRASILSRKLQKERNFNLNFHFSSYISRINRPFWINLEWKKNNF